MNRQIDDRRYLIPFRVALLPQIFTDVLIIGSGVAGLRAALAASEFGDVIVASKGDLQQSNTYLAQGGIASVNEGNTTPTQNGSRDQRGGDSFDLHAADTLEAGAGLCDQPTVQRVVAAGPARVHELIQWGMRFDQQPGGDGGPALGREGGHAVARILHADGDATGRELIRTLSSQVDGRERVRLFENCFVLDLLTVGSPPAPGSVTPAINNNASNTARCIGAITHHPRYGLQVIWAKATILASGGCGQLYRETTNAGAATGDGLALAYRAGAVLADMAFVQFHPTTLYVAGAARSLISEAVRGEGATLIDRNGYRFMPDYDQRAELAPRDVVSRAILAQIAKTNFTHAYLDCRSIGRERFAKRFPGISAVLDKFGIDPGTDPVPIHPSAHYMIGGVRVDSLGRTNISGLYACGEAACTGLNGANRLASNSLLEGLVCGHQTGHACYEMLDPKQAGTATAGAPINIVSDIRPSDRSELDLADVRSSLESVMWRHVGIERDGDRLAEVLEMFDFWARYTLDKIFDDQNGWEVQNMLQIGALITRAAQWRAESRGTHYRLDHPEQRDGFRCHDLWQRGQTEPVRSLVTGAEKDVPV